jgi:RND family efflux transporter MFP subunit
MMRIVPVVLGAAAVVAVTAAGVTMFAPGPVAALLDRFAPAPPSRAAYAQVDNRSAVATVSSDAKPDARPPLAPAVTVIRAGEQKFVETLFASGTLVARNEAMVGAQLDGLRIVELLAEDGDRVQQGQVLTRLDRSQLDAMVAQNDAALVRADAAIAQAHSQVDQFDAARIQAAADLARARKLDVGIVTQATLDQRIAAARTADAQLAAATSARALAQADKASREAERRELMVRLDRVDVKAPVSGIVSRRTARLGAVAMGAGDALFRIIADGAIELDAEVPEAWMARLAPAMPAKIALAGGERPVDGQVRLISSEVDRATRLGKVRIALPLDAPARIGSFATGSIEVGNRSGVAVPASAVVRGESGDVVQVVNNGRIEQREVTLGVTNQGSTEIRNGLAAGDVVVARAAAFLRGGDAVRPVEIGTEEAAK